MWWDVVLRRNTGTAHEFNRRNKWVQNDIFTLTRLSFCLCVLFSVKWGVEGAGGAELWPEHRPDLHKKMGTH